MGKSKRYFTQSVSDLPPIERRFAKKMNFLFYREGVVSSNLKIFIKILEKLFYKRYLPRREKFFAFLIKNETKTEIKMRLIVTGGAGFIGSAVIRHVIQDLDWTVLNVDCLTYAGNPESLRDVQKSPNYRFSKTDIGDLSAMSALFAEFEPDAVMHLAAESHVDRSIDAPMRFIETNVVGTATLLNAALDYWRALPGDRRERFRFHHISTDEVYGSLGPAGFFTEETAYSPRSPYSASKASSDHLVRAWRHTFGLPTIVTNCSNNYGPYHFPEKLIPLIILNALDEKPLPVYGRGENIRDWLYVEDHARALAQVVSRGAVGETYNIGGSQERKNIEVVLEICRLLDEMRPRSAGSYAELIEFVADRPGHDLRYAVCADKIGRELGWRPRETFESGLCKTVDWYLANEWWWRPIRENRYDGARLGGLNEK